MKRVLALVLVAILIAGCAAFADGGKQYKVAMICDSSINDGGWGSACYNAMVAAAEKNGCLGGRTAQRLACRVKDVPLAGNCLLFCECCRHYASSNFII